MATQHNYKVTIDDVGGGLVDIDFFGIAGKFFTLTKSGNSWSGDEDILTDDTVHILFSCRGLPEIDWKITIERDDNKKTPVLTGTTLKNGREAGTSSRNRDIDFS